MKSENAVRRRVERVALRTERYLVVGDMTLPPEGYRSRFSDMLNGKDGFIALADVEISPLDGGEVEKHPFLALSKAHVQHAYPLETPT